MRRPEISVIVPFLDAHLYLPRCLGSLLGQTLGADDYELIFVDNDSSDGGADIVAAHPRVRLLREPRRGAYAARNLGLREACGRILAFTDPDCEAEPDWLERIAATMRDDSLGVLLGHRLPATDGGVLSLVMAYESQKAAYVTGSGSRDLVFGHANNMAVRRAVMEQVGPFPEVQRGGDTILVRRAVDAFGCGVVRYRPEVRVRHLEVGTLRGYYGKARLYGGSNERLRAFVPFRPLRSSERWEVFRRTLAEQRCSAGRAALLLAALVPGALCYEWGRHALGGRRNGDGLRAGPGDL